MKRILSAFHSLTILFSTMSIILLLDYGLSTGKWVEPIRAMIEFWDQGIGVLFTKLIPLTPMIEGALRRIASAFN